ncbi:MAG: hypothetical protein LH660_05085 [Phormidesmis sp. CAN_BIN36]|nr:hypothetical protein [Phormidesmis sp. CAN_BIN36]
MSGAIASKIECSQITGNAGRRNYLTSLVGYGSSLKAACWFQWLFSNLCICLLLQMSKHWRYPARVLGCLRDGEITIILCAGIGLADGGNQQEIPTQVVPIDLRMPNSEFDVLFDRTSGCFVKVLRKKEVCLEAD